MDQGTQYDPLEDDFRDQLAAIGKGAVSLVPLFGGPLAEIIGVAIPNQRIDRITAYVRGLASRIEQMEGSINSASASQIDLIEEGGYQSARALSDDRISQIAEAVSRGLLEDDADVLRRRRLLVLFGELDDDEVGLLHAYGRSYAGAERGVFQGINRPDPPHLRSTPEDVERHHLFEAGKDHLLRVNLLTRNYGIQRKGELPAFVSRLGDFKHSVGISKLGRLLLREVGLETPYDRAQAEKRSGR